MDPKLKPIMLMKLKFFIAIIVCTLFLNISYCQNVTNVLVDINQNVAKITYDLKYISDVELQLSVNGEKFIPVTGTGDIGNYIKDGTKKSITFFPPKEFYVCYNCIFRVTAVKSEIYIDPRDQQWYAIFMDRIGNIWMAENLNYIEPNGSIFNKDLDIKTSKEYGRLYDWKIANLVCPSGWHLPSKNEWDNMIEEFGDKNKAGAKMKSPNGKFNAKLAGFKLENASSIDLVGNFGSWWTSDYLNNENAISYNIRSTSSDILYNGLTNKSSYRSIRCIKN